VARTTRTRRFAIAIVSAALLSTGLGVIGAGSAGATTGSMLGQVNAARAAHGDRALVWNSHLASVAQEQANRMAKKRELYHNPNLAGDVGSYRWVGENVGYGPSSSVIQDAFMDSPGHRANILDDDFTQIGIAERRDSKGRLWVAQVFRKPVSEGSGSSGNASAPKAKKPKATTTKKQTSTAPKKATRRPAAAPTATAKPSRAATKPAAPKKRRPAVAQRPTAAPQPTLAQRVAYVQQAAGSGTGSDPVAATLAFATAMNAVAS
jgi:hypothetical protein